MKYEIIDELPMPKINDYRWTEERKVMDKLEVGQSIIVADADKVNAVRCIARYLKPKRFTVRKLRDGRGWGVWRVHDLDNLRGGSPK